MLNQGRRPCEGVTLQGHATRIWSISLLLGNGALFTALHFAAVPGFFSQANRMNNHKMRLATVNEGEKAW